MSPDSSPFVIFLLNDKISVVITNAMKAFFFIRQYVTSPTKKVFDSTFPYRQCYTISSPIFYSYFQKRKLCIPISMNPQTYTDLNLAKETNRKRSGNITCTFRNFLVKLTFSQQSRTVTLQGTPKCKCDSRPGDYRFIIYSRLSLEYEKLLQAI